jgi:hypothetical protein
MANWLEQFGGGIRDDYDLTILSAYFAPDAAYNEGQQFLLHLIGIDENGDPVTEKFNAAKTSEWASFDGGKTIVPQNPQKLSRLNRSSIYGKLCEAAIGCGAGDVLASRGDNTNSQAWVGLKFHMKETEIAFGKKLDPVHRNLPSAFLGVDSEAQSAGTPVQQSFQPVAPVVAQPTPQAATAASTAVVAPVVMAAPSAGSGQTSALTVLAKSSPSFDDFIGRALAIPGVMADDTLLSSLTSNDSDGFYAQHH